MGDDDQAGTSGAHRVQEYLHGPLGGQGVQGAGGLVGEEQTRVGHQCSRDGGPLRLPARELGGALVQVLAEPQLAQDLAGLGQRPPARGARQEQGDGDVVQGGEVRQELAELEDEAELFQAQAAAGRLVEGRDVLCRVGSVVVDAPGVGHEDPGHDVQEGGLPRARRAGDGQDLTGRDVQVDAAQRVGLPEAHLQAAGAHDDLARQAGLALTGCGGDSSGDGGGDRGGVHERTSSRSSFRRAAVVSIQRRSASMWNRAWSASSTVRRSPSCLRRVSSRIRAMCSAR